VFQLKKLERAKESLALKNEDIGDYELLETDKV